MRRMVALLLAAVAVLPAPGDGLAQGSQAGIGVNAAIRNVVQMKTARDRALRPAVLREDVHIGDRVASGPNSALQVLLRDQSVFTVGANARMTIDRFVYDPARGTGAVAASIAKGAFRFMSGRAAHAPGQVAIRTPVASIGVRGTIVEVLVGQEAIDLLADVPGMQASAIGADPSSCTIVVLRGPGPNRIGSDRVGAIDVTADGHTTSVTSAGLVVVPGPGQPPLGPFPLPPEVGQKLDESLRTAPMPQTSRDLIPGVVAQVQKALDTANKAEFAYQLAQIALDTPDPRVLQAALARVGAEPIGDPTRADALAALSYLVASTTNAPAVGAMGDRLASADGREIIADWSGQRDLPSAMRSYATEYAQNDLSRDQDPVQVAQIAGQIAVESHDASPFRR